MVAKQELLIGCGSNHDKRLTCDDTDTWTNLTTLDYNPAHKPDIVWDLHDLPLPFPDSFFDEIHAYEVLEHVGAQGDWKTFFSQFSEFYRVLKHGGHFLATVPSRNSPWAWGDPSHTRIIQAEQLLFLHQPQYAEVGKTSMSDFRHFYTDDFDIMMVKDDGESLSFVLKAVKPSRLYAPATPKDEDEMVV